MYIWFKSGIYCFRSSFSLLTSLFWKCLVTIRKNNLMKYLWQKQKREFFIKVNQKRRWWNLFTSLLAKNGGSLSLQGQSSIFFLVPVWFRIRWPPNASPTLKRGFNKFLWCLVAKSISQIVDLTPNGSLRMMNVTLASDDRSFSFLTR